MCPTFYGMGCEFSYSGTLREVPLCACSWGLSSAARELCLDGRCHHTMSPKDSPYLQMEPLPHSGQKLCLCPQTSL